MSRMGFSLGRENALARFRFRIALRPSRGYRYYLLWMTALPQGQQSATISELTLLR